MARVASTVPSAPGYHSQFYNSCESFPGFGSARDLVELVAADGVNGRQGSFNISTDDYLSSRSCNSTVSLKWGHYGSYKCLDTDIGTARVEFQRTGLWLFPQTIGGLLFSKVLCPHARLDVGVRTEIKLAELSGLCSAVSFDNCATYYDALSTESAGQVLRRSKAPSCNANATVKADGPMLTCSSVGACVAPC